MRSSNVPVSGPKDTATLKTQKKWVWGPSVAVAPIYIAGSTLGFRITTYELDQMFPEGNQIQFFRPEDGLSEGSFPTTPLPGNEFIFAAFPPSVDANSNIVVAVVTFNTTITTPQLHGINGSLGVAFTLNLTGLVENLPATDLFIGMEFFDTDLLIITNRGTVSSISTYILVNVSSGVIVWQRQNLFETIDDQYSLQHFTPTLISTRVSGYHLLVTNTSGGAANHSITDFVYNDILNPTPSILWSYTFQAPFPSGPAYQLLQPMPILYTIGDMIISALVNVDHSSTENSYLIALDFGGRLLWSITFNETICGYATVPQIGILYVTSQHTVYSYNAGQNNITENWRARVDSMYISPLSPPTTDMDGNVYFCHSGTIFGYDKEGNMIVSVEDPDAVGEICDQPVLLQGAVMARMNIASIPTIFCADLQEPVPTPPHVPAPVPEENPAGLIIGIIIGIIFLGVILVIIVRYRRRRSIRRYEVLN